MTWDEERVKEVINQAFEDILNAEGPSLTSEYPSFKKMVELLGSVRAETIGWTWVEACNQASRGMDPRFFEVPKLLEKAQADLNPERDAPP